MCDRCRLESNISYYPSFQVRRFLDVTGNTGDMSKMYVNFCSGSSLLVHPDQVARGSGTFFLIYLLAFYMTPSDLRASFRRNRRCESLSVWLPCRKSRKCENWCFDDGFPRRRPHQQNSGIQLVRLKTFIAGWTYLLYLLSPSTFSVFLLLHIF